MEFKQLFYFVEVAKYGGFSQASKALFVTPQALSKSISQLEKEYGCQLFIRKNNVLELSDVGHQFLDEAKALLEKYYKADQHIKQLSELERGYFRVAVAHNSLNIIDIDLFKMFKRRYPQLDPDYLEVPDKLVDEYIEADRVEVCLNINTLPSQEEYESLLVYPSEICAITRGNDFWKNKDYVTIKDLMDQKLVIRGDLYKSFDIIEKAAQTEKVTLNYALKTSDEILMVDQASAPGYLGIGVYAMHGRPGYTRETAVPFRPSLPWNIYLSYKKYKPISKPVQLFIKFIKENYAARELHLQ